MPKIKTNKSAAKRFRITKNGKIKYWPSFGRHIMTTKSSKRRRHLRTASILAAVDTPRVKRMLPYG